MGDSALNYALTLNRWIKTKATFKIKRKQQIKLLLSKCHCSNMYLIASSPNGNNS